MRRRNRRLPIVSSLSFAVIDSLFIGMRSGVAQKTMLVSLLHALSLLVDAHGAVVFVDQNRNMSFCSGI